MDSQDGVQFPSGSLGYDILTGRGCRCGGVDRGRQKRFLQVEHTLDDFVFAVTVAADRALFASFRSSLDTSIVRSEICDTEPLELMGGFGNDAPGSNFGSLQNTY